MNDPQPSADDRGGGLSDKPGFRTPPGTGLFGMVLFLAALTMLFAATMLGYAVIRLTRPTAPPGGEVALPGALWVSTVLLIATGGVLQAAHSAIQRERPRRFCQLMAVTGVGTLGFLLVQAPAVGQMLRAHAAALASGDTVMHGLGAVIIAVHALHVVGGLVPLEVTTYRAFQNRYDHERHEGVTYCLLYWHFLEAVWLIMFGLMLYLG
jgi:heme/copper-type cytochrome/quinol oxidase subunit 3